MFSFGIFSTHIPYLVMIFLFVCSMSFSTSSVAGKTTTAKSRQGAVEFVAENFTVVYSHNIDFEEYNYGDIVYPLKFLALKFPAQKKYLFRFEEKQILQEFAHLFFERPPPQSFA